MANALPAELVPPEACWLWLSCNAARRAARGGGGPASSSSLLTTCRDLAVRRRLIVGAPLLTQLRSHSAQKGPQGRDGCGGWPGMSVRACCARFAQQVLPNGLSQAAGGALLRHALQPCHLSTAFQQQEGGERANVQHVP